MRSWVCVRFIITGFIIYFCMFYCVAVHWFDQILLNLGFVFIEFRPLMTLSEHSICLIEFFMPKKKILPWIEHRTQWFHLIFEWEATEEEEEEEHVNRQIRMVGLIKWQHLEIVYQNNKLCGSELLRSKCSCLVWHIFEAAGERKKGLSIWCRRRLPQ